MTRPNRPIRHLIVAAEACTVLLAGACYRSPGDTPAPPQVTLTVLAASSVGTVFSQIAGAFNRNHPSVAFQFSVGGTDQLIAQIEQGAPSDVFAGASTKYGDQLRSEGLIQPPEPFCTNRLVLVLPAANPAGITGLEDLTRPGLRLVIGAESVPVGAYTRTVLANLDQLYGARYSDRILANVVSNESNVEGVMAKVRLGEADAGFVYGTDSLAAGSDVRAIELPEQAQAVATYPIAVVASTRHRPAASQFVAFVLGPQAQEILRQAGFGPPTSS